MKNLTMSEQRKEHLIELKKCADGLCEIELDALKALENDEDLAVELRNLAKKIKKRKVK